MWMDLHKQLLYLNKYISIHVAGETDNMTLLANEDEAPSFLQNHQGGSSLEPAKTTQQRLHPSSPLAAQ
ncbi:unnamed protein product [Soboliphyme baturini]|uniref:Uncharacterized protein n=1 Tax=Soboliphyme baturini TaxID=241478 RepID=A0A183JAG8_9BILA|nr:unnamed protein product [Soboliphyme baturini]